MLQYGMGKTQPTPNDAPDANPLHAEIRTYQAGDVTDRLARRIDRVGLLGIQVPTCSKLARALRRQHIMSAERYDR
jgi:hypothetical protein